MDDAEIARLAALEDRHWWYAGRRELLRRELDRLPSGEVALDVGAAGGGNTRLLRDHGWRPIACEYNHAGARIARSRGLTVIRADAHHLPLRDEIAGLATAFDVIEHLTDDLQACRELHRTLRPGATLLVAVPADPALWSGHDVAVGHLRRYTRETLVDVITKAGFTVDDLWSWNVLLKPLVAIKRRQKSHAESDLDEVPAPLNAALGAIVALERRIPALRRRPGVSLFLRARRA